MVFVNTSRVINPDLTRPPKSVYTDMIVKISVLGEADSPISQESSEQSLAVQNGIAPLEDWGPGGELSIYRGTYQPGTAVSLIQGKYVFVLLILISLIFEFRDN